MVPHRAAHFVYAVGDACFWRAVNETGTIIVFVAVPAGDAERVAGGLDARAGDVAAINRLAEPDILKAGGADHSHRGKPGHQGAARVLGAEGHAEAGVVIDRRLERARILNLTANEMHVHVDEAGEQGHITEVDLPRAGRNAHAACGADSDNAVVGHDHDPIGNRGGAGAVNDTRRADGDGPGARGGELLGAELRSDNRCSGRRHGEESSERERRAHEESANAGFEAGCA